MCYFNLNSELPSIGQAQPYRPVIRTQREKLKVSPDQYFESFWATYHSEI